MSPIETKGNWFWKDDQRFLIRGVTYSPRQRPQASGNVEESSVNPLSEDWLPELRKDIPFFHQLGINAIFLNHTDPTDSPESALQLLHDEGLYVLLELFTNVQPNNSHQLQASEIDLQRLYSSSKVRKNLAVVGQTARFPNMLGYSISQSVIWSAATTKLAALHRAAVRDTKLFLHKSGARQIPVGANMSSNQQYRLPALQYMSAGPPDERVDFMSFGVYDWAGPSNFQISGYKQLCEAFEPWPVPMFFAEYGTTFSGRERLMDEVGCLFSPDMAGVFSGGFLHTYGHTEVREESGGSQESDDELDDDDDEGGYDLVRIEECGSRRPKRGFVRYQQRLTDVERKFPVEVVGEHEMKDSDSWRGGFQPRPRFWEADAGDVPVFPLDWDYVVE